MESNKIELRAVGGKFHLTDISRNLLESHLDDEGPLEIRLEQEPESEYDEYAIKILIDDDWGQDTFIGYIGRPENKFLNLLLQKDGVEVDVLKLVSYNAREGNGHVEMSIRTNG